MALLAAVNGDFQFALTFGVVPTFIANGTWAIISVVLLFAGIALLAASVLLEASDMADDAGEPSGNGETPPLDRPAMRSTGLILIGPFPIIWGSDPRMLPIAALIGIVMLAMMFIALLLL